METLIILAVVGFVLWRFVKRFQKALGENSQHQLRQMLNQPGLSAEQRARIQALLSRLEGAPSGSHSIATAQQTGFQWSATSAVEASPASADRYVGAESHPAIHGSIEDELLHEVTYDDTPVMAVTSIEATGAMVAADAGEGISLLSPSKEEAPITPAERPAKRIKSLLREPKSLRDTVLASELLKRPEW